MSQNRELLVTFTITASIAVAVKSFGFLKELTVAYYFGLSEELDAYLFLMVWVLFFITPVAGSFSTILTPIRASFAIVKDLKSFNAVSFKLLILIVIISGLMAAITFAIILLVNPSLNNGTFNLTNNPLFLLPSIILFVGISIFAGGLLISEGRTSTYTIIPIAVPISIVIWLICFPQLPLLYRLVIGTCFGFCLEMLIGLFAIRKHIQKGWVDIKIDPKVKEILKSQIPLLTASAFVSNGTLAVDQIMAKIAGKGAVSAISFGNKLSLALISIVSVLWVILYPVFSKYIANKNFAELRKIYVFWLCMIFFLGTPIFVFLAVFSEEITILLFKRGEFDALAVSIVSHIQFYYLLHVPLYVLCVVSSRIVNSLQHNSLLLYMSAFTLIINASLNLFFIEIFGVVGISIATLCAYIITSVCWIALSLNLIKLNHLNK